MRLALAIRPVLVAACLLAGATSARACGIGSPLALAVVTGTDRPQLLAQRSIERSWGPSDDSVYVEVDIPEWREEWVAMSLSAVVPGAGQGYVGAWVAAAAYAAVEAAGWISREMWQDRGDELQDEAAVYAGEPSQAASRWSADRWAAATGSNATEALALYRIDPGVFYDRLAHDPDMLAGWSGDPEYTRDPFRQLRDHADDRFRYARYATGVLCLNHLVSAVDAILRARAHNARLTTGLKVRLRTHPSGEPSFAAAIERSF